MFWCRDEIFGPVKTFLAFHANISTFRNLLFISILNAALGWMGCANSWLWNGAKIGKVIEQILGKKSTKIWASLASLVLATLFVQFSISSFRVGLNSEWPFFLPWKLPRGGNFRLEMILRWTVWYDSNFGPKSSSWPSNQAHLRVVLCNFLSYST